MTIRRTGLVRLTPYHFATMIGQWSVSYTMSIVSYFAPDFAFDFIYCFNTHHTFTHERILFRDCLFEISYSTSDLKFHFCEMIIDSMQSFFNFPESSVSFNCITAVVIKLSFHAICSAFLRSTTFFNSFHAFPHPIYLVRKLRPKNRGRHNPRDHYTENCNPITKTLWLKKIWLLKEHSNHLYVRGSRHDQLQPTYL